MIEDYVLDLKAHENYEYPTAHAYLNAFIEKSQEKVTDTVKVKLFKGNLMILTCSSPNTLYSEELIYFDR